MNFRSISEVSEAVRLGKASPVELTQECLERVERLSPSLNAFITVTGAKALRQAREAENKIRSSHWRGPLHGIPVGLKDLIDTAGIPTTAASAVFRDRVPKEDAAVVSKLKAAGAVQIGKQNLHEFAYGGSSLISCFGPVRNPVNSEFIAGGSSGGSAAAVAAGMCYAAIGTDTAGSIREPAALCGVVGFKPTYNLVSTQGIIPLSTSLDHAGPITRSVEDAAILLDAITGTSPGYRKCLDLGIRKLVLGVPRKFFFDDCESEIVTAIDQAIERLSAHAAKICEIDLPILQDRTVFNFECFSYHRRRVEATPHLYDPETLRRIRNCEGVSEAEYRAAVDALSKTRREITEKLDGAGVDVILTPTTPAPPPRISDLMADPSRLRATEVHLLRNTRPMNVWGMPAISIPCGTTSSGLPIGLQIASLPGRDDLVLRVSHAYEQLGRN